MAIRSFGDPATADLYHGRNTARSRRFSQSIVSVALRKVDVLNAAHKLDDLRSSPGNRLEALKGDLEGFIVFASMINPTPLRFRDFGGLLFDGMMASTKSH